jgi:hypothetical protein
MMEADATLPPLMLLAMEDRESWDEMELERASMPGWFAAAVSRSDSESSTLLEFPA